MTLLAGEANHCIVHEASRKYGNVLATLSRAGTHNVLAIGEARHANVMQQGSNKLREEGNYSETRG
jgi:hypothetical protein